MARPPRTFIEGIPIHVTMRGVDRQAIFRDDSDRLYYRVALEDAARTYGFAIHAYVFMTNHVHLFGTPQDRHSTARLFQSVAARYVYRFNRRYQRVGPVSQGRHKVILVKTDGHFVGCMRYIENNPVAAGMVLSPAAYPWSSHACNALGRPDSLVTPHPLYLELSPDPVRRCQRYAAGFDDEDDRKYREIFRSVAKSTFAVGDSEFVEWAAMKTGQRLPRVMSTAALGSDPGG